MKKTKNELSRKLYKITLGEKYKADERECFNASSYTIIAEDASDAYRLFGDTLLKIEKKIKKEVPDTEIFVASIELISVIDDIGELYDDNHL